LYVTKLQALKTYLQLIKHHAMKI